MKHYNNGGNMQVNRLSQRLITKQNTKKQNVENKKRESNTLPTIHKKKVGAALLAGLMLASINSQNKPI